MPSNVTLVSLHVDHIDHVMTWVNDPEVMRYFANRQHIITRTEELDYLAAISTSPTDRVYSIFDGATYLGQCSINQIHWPALNGSLFVTIRKSEQGKGYGSAAVKALLDRAWGTIELHKVWLMVRQDNRHAQAMYIRLGFSFEGILRDEYRVGDRYYDMVRMGVLNPDQSRV